jgi:Immunoglobulin domain
VFLINYAVGENSGVYDVIAANAGGSALSTGALVRVAIPPSILIAPTNVPARPGSNAVFTVVAGGEKPLSYQWRKNGVILPGETAATLMRTNVQLADEAEYEVTIMNPSGSASVTANLFILINPGFTLQPLSQQVPVNSPVTLSISFTGNPAPFSIEWRRSATPLATNVISGLQDFFTFTATNVPMTLQYRAIVRNLAVPTGVGSALANITTVADTDGDGISDTWEQQFGLNPSSAADRNLDLDGDGSSNWSEFMAGTNPSDSNSFLRVSLQVVGTPSVEFAAISNRTYTVQYSDALGWPWQRLANVLARTNNRVEIIPDSAWTTNRFYRLVTPWQP